MSEEHNIDCSGCETCENPSNGAVMNKYKTAGIIAKDVLEHMMKICLPGSSVYSLCRTGDKLIEEMLSKVFTKDKTMKKGQAFPTCISPNNIVCHFSPLKDDDITIMEGDVVKIDLGVHIDGYAACVATTIVAGASKENPARGKKGDVIMAGYKAAELALKCMKPGLTNNTVSETITKVSEQYDCKPVEDLMSYSLHKYVLEGNKRIIVNPSEPLRATYETDEFEPWDVFYVDVFITTDADGKAKQREARTTVFRRTGKVHELRLKNSKEIYRQIMTNFIEFGFSLNSFEETNKAKMAAKESLDHGLVCAYPVMWVKDQEFVSHFKFTAVVGPNGPMKIVFPPFMPETVVSSKKIINPELIKLVNEPLISKTESRGVSEVKA